MSARGEILGRVRNALGQRSASAEDTYQSLPRHYHQRGQLGREAAIDLFVERLLDYDAGVMRCVGEAAIAPAIEQLLSERGKKGLLVPPDVPATWLPSSFAFQTDHGDLSYAAIDKSEGVLTGCALSIALTGTIVLRHSVATGRRALTLIPDYHLCVVLENQVVETVPEAIRQIKAYGTDPITTISGPSATADIEMTRVKGVHGPRFLDVILVR